MVSKIEPNSVPYMGIKKNFEPRYSNGNISCKVITNRKNKIGQSLWVWEPTEEFKTC